MKTPAAKLTRNRLWRERNKARVLETARTYYQGLGTVGLERRRTNKRVRYEENPEPTLQTNRNWRDSNLDRVRLMHRAQQVVYRALRSGMLVRPDVCSRCLVSGRIEAAHSDYNHPLQVTWLCRPCHRQWDSAQPKSQEGNPTHAHN